MDETDSTGLWCRWCDQPVMRKGRGPVHVSSGERECADGTHTADPSGESPVMRAEARTVSAEFSGRWEVGVYLGIFRAVPANMPLGSTPVPVHASSVEELRHGIRTAESIARLNAAARERRDAGTIR